MTQDELAKAVNATKRQIGAWERGENDLPLDFAYAIADVLGCTIDDIAGINAGDASELTPYELELVDIMRSITPQGQRQLLVFARGIAASYPKNNRISEANAS